MKTAFEMYILVSIFLLAFIVRVLFALQADYIPESDAYVYDQLALSISQGNGYADSKGSPHSFYPPFYPLFLSLIYKFFGHSYIAVKIIQSIMGGLTSVLVYLIGKRVYNRTAGILAAFISIMYPPFVKAAGLLLAECIFTFLLCLIIYYLLKLRLYAKYKHCVIVGLLLGVALLTKSMALLLPLFIVPIFIYSAAGKRDILKKYIVVLLFFILPIVPWIIRNYHVYHRFVPLATQGGITFYSSYRPPNNIFGTLASVTDDPAIKEAGNITDPVLRSNFLIRKTLEFIAKNPNELISLEFKKILYLWAPFDWEIVGGRWFNFIYAGMLPFFILGVFFAFKDFMRFYPVIMPIIYFQILTLVFYGSPRFRLPIEPYIFILSISGILKCYDWIRNKKILSYVRL